MTEQDYVNAALKLARGVYQRALILGTQNWSGSDLKSTAKNYGAHYARSRRQLYERLRDNGLAYLVKGPKNRLELRWGEPQPWMRQTQCAAGECWIEGEPSLLEQIALAACDPEEEKEVA